MAAIDCGTNSTRLLVVDASGKTLDRQMRITRLGEGVDANRVLQEAAIARTVAVLEDYRRVMDELGVVRVRMAATSAARDAVNAENFFSAAAKVVGVRPEPLSGEEEGRLSFAGATAHLPDWMPREEPVLVVDIGGGSTELVVGRPSDDQSVRAVSLDIGCVRVTERFFRRDPPTPRELVVAKGVIRDSIDRVRDQLAILPRNGTLVGVAGTVATLAALENSVVVYDRDQVHHVVLGRNELERWLAVLSSEPSSARLARSEVVRGREDVIVGGALVLLSVMDYFGFTRCLSSEDDILDGLAASLQDSDPA